MRRWKSLRHADIMEGPRNDDLLARSLPYPKGARRAGGLAFIYPPAMLQRRGHAEIHDDMTSYNARDEGSFPCEHVHQTRFHASACSTTRSPRKMTRSRVSGECFSKHVDSSLWDCKWVRMKGRNGFTTYSVTKRDAAVPQYLLNSRAAFQR